MKKKSDEAEDWKFQCLQLILKRFNTTKREMEGEGGRDRERERPLWDAYPIRHIIAPTIVDSADIVFLDIQDTTYWRWEASGQYSARSIYRVMIGGGKVVWRFKGIWKARVPPTVKVFSIMLLKGKIPTHDMLRARIHCDALSNVLKLLL